MKHDLDSDVDSVVMILQEAIVIKIQKWFHEE